MGEKACKQNIFSIHIHHKQAYTVFKGPEELHYIRSSNFFSPATYSKIGVTAWDRQAVSIQHTLPPSPDCEGQWSACSIHHSPRASELRSKVRCKLENTFQYLLTLLSTRLRSLQNHSSELVDQNKQPQHHGLRNWKGRFLKGGMRWLKGKILLILSWDPNEIHWIIEKARKFQKNIYFCFINYAKAFECVDHHKLWKILKEMGIPDHLACLLRNLYQVRKQQLELDMEQQTGSK